MTSSKFTKHKLHYSRNICKPLLNFTFLIVKLSTQQSYLTCQEGITARCYSDSLEMCIKLPTMLLHTEHNVDKSRPSKEFTIGSCKHLSKVILCTGVGTKWEGVQVNLVQCFLNFFRPRNTKQFFFLRHTKDFLLSQKKKGRGGGELLSEKRKSLASSREAILNSIVLHGTPPRNTV